MDVIMIYVSVIFLILNLLVGKRWIQINLNARLVIHLVAQLVAHPVVLLEGNMVAHPVVFLKDNMVYKILMMDQVWLMNNDKVYGEKRRMKFSNLNTNINFKMFMEFKKNFLILLTDNMVYKILMLMMDQVWLMNNDKVWGQKSRMKFSTLNTYIKIVMKTNFYRLKR